MLIKETLPPVLRCFLCAGNDSDNLPRAANSKVYNSSGPAFEGGWGVHGELQEEFIQIANSSGGLRDLPLPVLTSLFAEDLASDEGSSACFCEVISCADPHCQLLKDQRNK